MWWSRASAAAGKPPHRTPRARHKCSPRSLRSPRLLFVAAAAWARRAQAADQRTIAELTVEDTKRQIAVAAADAYLTILAQRRIVEGNVVARDVAKAHFDLASELERGGTGSRLNALRAQQ